MTTSPHPVPQAAFRSRTAPGAGERSGLDLGLVGIVLGFASFVVILLSNTLPAQRELRSRERIADEYEDAVLRLREELERERRYHDAVRNDPDVILSLWLRRNPAAEEADPGRVPDAIPRWWNEAPPEDPRSAANLPPRETRPPLVLPERAAPRTTTPSRPPGAPSPPPRPPRASAPRQETTYEFPAFLLR